MKTRFLLSVCICTFLYQPLASAQSASPVEDGPKETMAAPLPLPENPNDAIGGAGESESGSESERWIFSNKMSKPGVTRNSVFWLPLLSYVAPGSVQFMNAQYGAAITYTAVGAGGMIAALAAQSKLADPEYEGTDEGDLDSRNRYVRQYLWGMKTYDLAGSLSMYHAFQTSLEFRKAQGDFAFLPKEGETTDELMVAPFKFSNLSRWTTLVPLGAALGLMIAAGANDDYNTRQLNSGDILFSGGISYNAGVGEEAMFRGWMFPLLVEAYGVNNIFWANLTQAAIFGAAHLSSDNPLPLAQTGLGLYFGWLAQKNGWSLQESIFVHTWWDVIVFTAAFTQGDKKASIYVPLYQTQF